MSERASTSRPSACSGDIYPSVPTADAEMDEVAGLWHGFSLHGRGLGRTTAWPPGGADPATRLDAVYVNRDGFYRDPANDTTINDRDRLFLRGQLLFEPTQDLSVRIIGMSNSGKLGSLKPVFSSPVSSSLKSR